MKADSLRAEGIWKSSQDALHEYELAQRLWHLTNNALDEQETLCKMGELYNEIGERSAALSKFKEALLISRGSRAVLQKTYALNGICAVQTVMGKYSDALTACEAALSLSREQKDATAQATSHRNLGMAYYDLGDLDRALEHQRKALDLYRNLGNKKGEALSLFGLSSVMVVLGQIQDALTADLQSLSIFQSVNYPTGQALCLATLGHLHAVSGNEQKAIEDYAEALRLAERMRNSEVTAQACSGLGFVYYQLGEFERSLSYRQRALNLYQLLPDLWGESSLHMSIGRVYLAMGDLGHALKHYEQGLAVARQLANHHLQSALTREIGAVFKQSGQSDKALQQYQRSLVFSHLASDPRDEADALNRIGDIHAESHRSELALKYFNLALGLARSVADRATETQTLARIARAQGKLGKFADAQTTIEAALKTIESLRTNLISQELRSSYFATVRTHYELEIEILMQLHKANPRAGFDVKALEMSERARARSLLETLTESRADISEGVDPSLLLKGSNIERELDVKAERRAQLLSLKKNEEAKAVSEQIDQLTAEYENLMSQIRAKSPRYAALTQPQPLTVNEVQQQVLRDDSLLLEYALGDERSYVWAVSRTEVSSYELPGRAQIEASARRLYDLFSSIQPKPGETFQQRQARVNQAESQLRVETATLSKLLLAPIADQLGTKRLLIVPDGALQYIPFQALTVPADQSPNDSVASTGTGEQVPLLLQHEIINEPSASTLALVLSESANRKSAPKSVAILADPVFEMDDSRIKSPGAGSLQAAVTSTPNGEVTRALRDVGVEGGQIPRLLSSRAEAEAIMAVVPWRSGFKAVDFDANRATAMGSDLGQYRVVHFATHALLDNEHPELSGIVLSLVDQKGQRQDGFLRLHDIYNLKLPVDLVVLSACQTGLGKDVKGEGLIGLTRGFMYAGASGVVASLWKVDDEATAELMKHFYAGMFGKGLSPSAALREAQLALRQQKRWQEPYYWAGFVIQGQYANQGRSGYQLTPAVKLAIFVSVGLALSLSVFLVLWRRRRSDL